MTLKDDDVKPSSSSSGGSTPLPVHPRIFAAILTILLVVAVDVLGMMLLLPIVDTFAQDLGASKAMIGTQFTVYAACAIFSSLVVGYLSDRFGRKWIFFFSAMGASIASIGCIFVTNFTLFLIYTGISGLCTGTVGTAYAYIGDLIHNEQQRAQYIAYVTATLSLCFVIGPVVGGSVAILNIRAPFYISAGIALLEVVLVWFCLQEPKEFQAQYGAMYSSLLGSEDTGNINSNNGMGMDGDEAGMRPRSLSRATSFSGLDEALVQSTLHSATNPMVVLAEEQDWFDTAKDIIQYHTEEEEAMKQLEASFVTILSQDGQSPPPKQSSSISSDNYYNSNNNKDNKNKQSKKKKVLIGKSPWMDYRALFIGGLGTFLNNITYLGIIIIIPLVLQESKFNIVSNDDNESDLTNKEVKTISMYMGFFLSCYGLTQVLGMVWLFPFVQHRVGLLNTGVIGSLLYGGGFLLTLCIDQPNAFYGMYIVMAIGNSLCRPMFPTYLNSIANPERRAEYMTISATFSNIALMIGGQMTLMYHLYSEWGTVWLCGSASLVNAVLILIFAWTHPPVVVNKQKTVGQEQERLENEQI